MNQTKISEMIKDIRNKNNLTQADLANHLGVTYQAVSKWETGKNIPDIAILQQISKEYNIDINELLLGKNKNKKIKFIHILVALLLLITIILFIYYFVNKNKNFEFKTITTTCEEFSITGSAAYNKDKTSIYISNITYCGGDDVNMYDEINCALYESHNDIYSKVSECSNTNNKLITLSDYLKSIQFNINNYSAMCHDFMNSNMYLEINATENNKTTKYNIPLTFNDNCINSTNN